MRKPESLIGIPLEKPVPLSTVKWSRYLAVKRSLPRPDEDENSQAADQGQGDECTDFCFQMSESTVGFPDHSDTPLARLTRLASGRSAARAGIGGEKE